MQKSLTLLACAQTGGLSENGNKIFLNLMDNRMRDILVGVSFFRGDLENGDVDEKEWIRHNMWEI